MTTQRQRDAKVLETARRAGESVLVGSHENQLRILRRAYNDRLWHLGITDAAAAQGVDCSTDNPAYVQFCRERSALVPGEKFPEETVN